MFTIPPAGKFDGNKKKPKRGKKKKSMSRGAVCSHLKRNANGDSSGTVVTHMIDTYFLGACQAVSRILGSHQDNLVWKSYKANISS